MLSPGWFETPMLKEVVGKTEELAIVLMDSISSVDAADAGQIVVCGSHGGRSSGEFATRFPLGACFFNDAGVGKDHAGVVALRMLDERGVPGGTVSHHSARIGDARDTWENGVLSHLNGTALAREICTGDLLRDSIQRFLNTSSTLHGLRGAE